jgi:hypothetical protein
MKRRVPRFAQHHRSDDDSVRLGSESEKVLADTRDVLTRDGQGLAAVESESHVTLRHRSEFRRLVGCSGFRTSLGPMVELAT